MHVDQLVAAAADDEVVPAAVALTAAAGLARAAIERRVIVMGKILLRCRRRAPCAA
jgi:hypothetical protein